ncbi:hypothetical protein FE257_004340 [Aspergillus nanangensis]|uniref:Uncharacterized protein n=1 Tax=Aspergillus nanangensis TaxID=2582783 RepID=A0AAD4GN42_ASPNN|nr:hypothetical protein FE257_004340 [Aspergillus nanangensis]
MDDKKCLQFLSPETIQQAIEDRNTRYLTLKTGLQLLAEEGKTLDILNEKIGIYHKFGPKAGGPFEEYSQKGRLPPHWIYRGRFPGIWCTLFSPWCTLGVMPIVVREENFGQLKINPGFKLYDPKSKRCQDLWLQWNNAENRAKPNSWEAEVNSNSESMEKRVGEQLKAPNHFQFYREHGFGAIIGYHDYIAIVIIDANAVCALHDARDQLSAHWQLH